MNNLILEDLHATREQLLAESGGILAGLVKRLQKGTIGTGPEDLGAKTDKGLHRSLRSSTN